MDPARVADMDASQLLAWVRAGQLREPDVLDALRNPYCTVEVAEAIASSPELLAAHGVRELLSSFRGLPFARAMDLIATLPWPSLLTVAQNPKSPPMVRRHADKKLVLALSRMSLGEKVALARRVHRELLRPLVESGDGQVLEALLDNPKLTESDVVLILNTVAAPLEFYGRLARHRRWGQAHGVRVALARCPHAPLPVALSVLVQLRSGDLAAIASRPDAPGPVRCAAAALREREEMGLRGTAAARTASDLPPDRGAFPG
ncbi:MAG TPA: hypothetical protein PKJ99_12040 [Thermoanaerobaculales bacterium]|nr:hypothetical protein [Thermoanaerobaculales bacterium]